jgi:hypothetical protein
MLGLGHPVDEQAGADSIMSHEGLWSGKTFVNRSYAANLFRLSSVRLLAVDRLQNPYLELVKSFRGQPDQSRQFTFLSRLGP